MKKLKLKGTNSNDDSSRLVICALILSIAVAFICALSGCTQVPIKNNEFFVDLGPDGAFAFYSLTPEKQRDIPKDEWDDMRIGMYSFSADTMANIKAAIKSLCSLSNGACDYQYHEMVTAFYAATDKAEAKVRRMKREKRMLLLPGKI